jgi:uncharacterized damage-inducible protein DinB
MAMTSYTAKNLARSFRIVRDNTLKIAEEIDEKDYGFKPAPESRTVAHLLAHIGTIHFFNMRLHRDDKANTLTGYDFGTIMGQIRAQEEVPRDKAQLIAYLKESREEVGEWMETLTPEFLDEMVEMPPGGDPPKSRFEMIMAIKEQEMHHRGQLMVYARMLGIVPHTTRAQQERFAAMQAAQAATAKA